MCVGPLAPKMPSVPEAPKDPSIAAQEKAAKDKKQNIRQQRAKSTGIRSTLGPAGFRGVDDTLLGGN